MNSYKWDYGDGTIETLTTPTVYHTFAASGNYRVALTVTDDHLAKGSVSTKISVAANVAPVASFTVVSTNGYAVNVQSTSTDSDGTV